MFDEATKKADQSLAEQWERELRQFQKNGEEAFSSTSRSGIKLNPVYGPNDIDDLELEDTGYPGVFPYTRGSYPLQYQSVGWMNQQVHGYGSPRETNERMRTLRSLGMEGYGGRPVFNLVFDLPTQEGYDADDEVSRGRVGQSGVAVSTVEDLDMVFAGFDLDEINASLIMADPSIAILGMYVILAERRGIAPEKLRGNTMNFLYNTFHFDRHGFPPTAAMKLIVELIKYTSQHMPRWNSTNLCGYNIRESGASGVQELAYVLATSSAITEACVAEGLDPDDFLPRFGFQMEIGNDLFEDIAKIRALRRMWARMNRDVFKASDPRAHQARIHVHTSGADLTAQQPLINIVRATLHTFAAALAGANSIQTSSYDEALSIPTEEAATIALRTQQVIRHESGLTNVSDPLGGSYYLEWLTDRVEKLAMTYLKELDEQGNGFMDAWETGWLRNRIATEAFREREHLESRERIVVGVNQWQDDEPTAVPVFRVSKEVEKTQVERLRAFRARRDESVTSERLKTLADAVRNEDSLMPHVLECFRVDATLGEVMGVFRDAWGRGSIYS